MKTLDNLTDWYMDVETSKTWQARLVKVFLFPVIGLIYFFLIVGFYLLGIIWDIFFSLPYWVITNETGPLWVRKNLYTLHKD